MSFIFRRVLSVCCASDYEVWKLTSRYLPKYVDAQEYLLIVPDNEVSFFYSITPSIWTVRGEGEFSYAYSKQAIDKRMVGENVGRAGWYLQQFLKINAILDPILKDDDYVLIWDADTVPLKKLTFVEKANPTKLMFYSGTKRGGNFSFIAQCLPTKVAWVREMLGSLPDYVDCVLEALPGESSSEFSEYEMIGSFVFLHYKNDVALNNRRWSRSLGGLIGISKCHVLNKTLLFVYSIFFDYVAFEKWQISAFKKVAVYSNALFRRHP
jgi:hypothetical protein